jgi:nucleotide-binding universal stress UspA family protein
VSSMTTILVGTDTSARAERAVEEAARLASAADAELLILYVRPVGDAREVVDPRKPADPERYLDRLRHRFRGVRTRTRTADGDPAEGIVRVAADEHADVIVVGNRGLQDRRRGFLQSVPARVANRAPCSVYIVDTRAAA